MRSQGGFTLIELSIVLVVIAFLMGAVMQGQKMLYNARMQRIVSDMDGYRQAFLLYYDRYGMYPGDENDPNFPAGDTLNGNHTGLIDPAEVANVWDDLATAMGVVRKASPVRGGTYNFGSRSFFGTGSQNCISVTNLPNKVAQSIDARHDDGVYNTGNIQSSASYDGSETLITLYWRI
jgi:prepilin-type N-terminal cleavage/methylation domain-containing protein